MRIHRALVGLLLLSKSALATERDWPAPPDEQAARRRLFVGVSSRAGLVKAPFVTTAFPEASGFATLVTGTAALQITRLGWLQLDLPVSLVRLDQPAGAQIGEATLGNLELLLTRAFDVQPTAQLELKAGLLVPTAGHGSEASLFDNRALALGAALDAGQNAAQLTPGVGGLRLGASFEHFRQPFGFRARLDLPILVRVSDASLPDETTTHPLGVVPALDVSAAWWVTRWLGAGVGAGVVTEPWRVQEPIRAADRDRRVQPVVRPELDFRIGRHVTLDLAGSIPIAGNLGGHAFSVALQGRVAF